MLSSFHLYLEIKLQQKRIIYAFVGAVVLFIQMFSNGACVCIFFNEFMLLPQGDSNDETKIKFENKKTTQSPRIFVFNQPLSW